MEKSEKIYVAGHNGLFGSALVRALHTRGYESLILRTHSQLDLRDQQACRAFFEQEKPAYVFMAAAKVGGIQANSRYMADFCMENLEITCNVLRAAHENGVKKLLYLGSSCIYPRQSQQPINEAYILTGAMEPTNEGYAIAKTAGIRLCDYYKNQYDDGFISCIPANVYGPGDNYDPTHNHVIPALIQRFHTAKVQGASEVSVWGSGKAEREFLYIDDAAEACLLLMDKYDGPGTVNIGLGESTTIAELAQTVQDVVDYKGALRFDVSKPDGMPKRLLDSRKIQSLGWVPRTSLRNGLEKSYEWYLNNIAKE